ncbi:copper resistance CopC family protein [Microbacterium invictum]|nr:MULTISPECIES: copper resistance CopC family protein [Microbacterium]
MSSGINRRSRIRASIAVLLGLVLAGIASPAFAHDELIGTEPAAQSTVEALPDELVLTFSGVLLDDAGATAVAVLDASCTSLTAGDPVIDGTKVIQPVTAGADGVVTVQWRVVSSDGHPISGEYTFTAGEGGSAQACDAAPDEETDAGAFPIGIVIAVLGVGIVAAGGGALALMLRRRPAQHED